MQCARIGPHRSSRHESVDFDCKPKAITINKTKTRRFIMRGCMRVSAVICRLQFWQNDRDRLRVTAVTVRGGGGGWGGGGG